MKAATAAAVALLTLPALAAAGAAAAQSWDAERGSRTWTSHGGHGGDFNGQADRPGDYRCDDYWDRGRDDCGAAWRDQRPFTRQYTSGHRRHDHGYDRGHGQAYYGVYGRPDLVYPGGGWAVPPGGGRPGERAAYCAARYRSYDPVSGFYRAYSGRLVFCG